MRVGAEKGTKCGRTEVRDILAPVAICSHLDQITIDPPDSVEGCEDCLRTGDRWVHLRVCLSCGHVGCCDSSKNKHASRHANEVGHPIVRSAEEGEWWCWCYVDSVMFELEDDASHT
jgi:uncharacterized UBP type Zn finger protein